MKCKNKRCNRQARKRGLYCAACCYQRHKKKYPVKRAFFTLRSNAQRRGKEFTLTLADFTDFCSHCNYIAGKGKTGNALTVDRIDEERGYSADNIQCLTNAENKKKYAAYRRSKKIGPCARLKAKSTKNTN